MKNAHNFSHKPSERVPSTLVALCACLAIPIPAKRTSIDALVTLAEHPERLAAVGITSASNANRGFCGYVTSAAQFGYPILSLSWNTHYRDSDRLPNLDRLLGCLHDDLVVHVSDGTDVIFTNTPAHLRKRYVNLRREIGADIFYQAECNAWPRCWDDWYGKAGLRCPEGENQCYVNSGSLTATVKALRSWVSRLNLHATSPFASWLPRKFANEQELVNAAYASPLGAHYRIALDHGGALSQVLHQCWGSKDPPHFKPPECRSHSLGGCAEMCRLTNPRKFRPLDHIMIQNDGTVTMARHAGPRMISERPSLLHCPAKNLGKVISNFTCEKLPKMYTPPVVDAPLIVLVGNDTTDFQHICRMVH